LREEITREIKQEIKTEWMERRNH